jgi:hypothetical protein
MHTDAWGPTAGYSEVLSGSDPQNRPQNSDVWACNDEPWLYLRQFIWTKKPPKIQKKNPQNGTSDFTSKSWFLCPLMYGPWWNDLIRKTSQKGLPVLLQSDIQFNTFTTPFKFKLPIAPVQWAIGTFLDYSWPWRVQLSDPLPVDLVGHQCKASSFTLC